mgnify:CR=1 FL=1
MTNYLNSGLIDTYRVFHPLERKYSWWSYRMKARERNVPVIFFNRSVDEAVVKSYDKCVFVGTDYEMAGHMQGEMVGNFLLKNYDAVDLNKDGKITVFDAQILMEAQKGLREKLEGSFTSPVIICIEGHICCQDSH